jgi:hypothetical protein
LTRRTLLQALAGALFQKKKKMSFTPHWIDAPHKARQPGTGRRIAEPVRVGDVLYDVCFRDDIFESTLYVSADAGVTWTDTGQTCEAGFTLDAPGKARFFFYSGGLLNLISLIAFDGTFLWHTIDPTSPTTIALGWTEQAQPSISGIPIQAHLGGVSNVPTSFFAGARVDGTILMGSTVDTGSYFAVEIWKCTGVGGTWTSLGQMTGNHADLGDGQSEYFFEGGYFDNASNLHFYAIFWDKSTVPSSPTDLVHGSVSAADDSLHGWHTVESAVDPVQSSGWSNHDPGSVDTSNRHAVAYSKGIDFGTGGIFGDLRVAFGDPTGDPLNPSWTLTTVVTGEIGTDYESANVFTQTIFLGTTPWVYWVSSYPNDFADFSSTWYLFRSFWNGSVWSSPEMLFDPSTDAYLISLGDGYAISNMQLLRAFGGAGVGIIIDVEDAVSAYDGPPITVSGGRYTFAYTGKGSPRYRKNLGTRSRSVRTA